MLFSILLGLGCFVVKKESIRTVQTDEECAWVTVDKSAKKTIAGFPIGHKKLRIEDSLFWCCPNENGNGASCVEPTWRPVANVDFKQRKRKTLTAKQKNWLFWTAVIGGGAILIKNRTENREQSPE